MRKNKTPTPKHATRALDVGCGSGDTTRVLSHFSNVHEILAFDASPHMIEAARRINPDASRIRYVASAVDQLESNVDVDLKSTFDLAISMQV